jgi:DNA-binding ferritin-like protein
VLNPGDKLLKVDGQPLAVVDDLAKIAQVRQYKDSLNNALYSVFKSTSQFRVRLSGHLPQVIAQLRKNAATNQSIPFAFNLLKQTETLNRIQEELESTEVVNDFPKVLAKLRPLLLDCIALPKVSKIKEARQNLQFLIRRVAEIERFGFSGRPISDTFHELFGDIRAALEQASAIEGLTEWEVVRYDDLKAKQAEHTTETAWNWSDTDQCQCTDCVEFRALKIKIKNDLNPRFRVFILQLKKQFLELRSRADIVPERVWTWIDITVRTAKRFADSFHVQEQSQNANIAERITNVFGQFQRLTLEERLKFGNADFERLFVTVEAVVQMVAGLQGPT